MIAGTHGINRCILSRQHHFIECSLWFGKFAVHRKGAGNVRGIVFNLTTGINQHQVAIFQRCAVFDVVQNAAIATATHNRRVGCIPGAASHEGMNQLGLELVFINTGRRFFHGVAMGLGTDFARLCHHLYFRWALVQPQVMQRMLKCNKLPWRLGTGAHLTPNRLHPFHDLTVERLVTSQRVINAATALYHSRQNLINIDNRKRIVQAEFFDRAFRARQITVPQLLFRIAFLAEQH